MRRLLWMACVLAALGLFVVMPSAADVEGSEEARHAVAQDPAPDVEAGPQGPEDQLVVPGTIFPDCTLITSSTTCEDTVCAKFGVKCYWQTGTNDADCTCITSSATGDRVSASCTAPPSGGTGE
jgi:hypothetical protein